MFKRPDVISPLERAFSELLKRKAEIAQAILAPAQRDAFEFGRICGLAQENQNSVSILEHCLDEASPDPREDREES